MNLGWGGTMTPTTNTAIQIATKSVWFPKEIVPGGTQMEIIIHGSKQKQLILLEALLLGGWRTPAFD